MVRSEIEHLFIYYMSVCGTELFLVIYFGTFMAVWMHLAFIILLLYSKSY